MTEIIKYLPFYVMPVWWIYSWKDFKISSGKHAKTTERKAFHACSGKYTEMFLTALLNGQRVRVFDSASFFFTFLYMQA